MKNSIEIILCILFIVGCKPEKENSYILVDDSVAETIKSDTIAPHEEMESDCIFNDDYLSLTKEWLLELGISNYQWDEKNNQAVIVEGSDSIYISKGGCTHFGFSVEQVLTSNSISLADSAYWTQTSLKLAERFEFENYSQSIRAGKVSFIENENECWFEVEDDNQDDNVIYPGIQISEYDGRKKIVISMYYN